MLNKKLELTDYIGIIFFIIAIGILCIMIFNPLNHLFIHIDEYFTFGLIHLPISNVIKITAADVHPPLYYIILKIATKILTVLHIPFNTLYVLKVVSIMPYFILLLFSGTKIRKEYGWLTAGISIFTIGIMSKFFIEFITIRMYGWGLLFLLLSFISLKKIITESDNKSWILLTIFTVLGAYTHYFVALSSGVLYLLLLIYILFIEGEEEKTISKIFSNLKGKNFKKWILSVISLIILYLPWIPVVIAQVTKVNNDYWIKPLTLEKIIYFFTYSVTNSTTTIMKILAIITLISILILFISKYKDGKKEENFYIFTGIFIFIGTLLIGTIVSLISQPILYDRYLLPSIGVLWFTFAVLIGKIQNKKKLTIILILILILTIGAISTNINTCSDLQDTGIKEHDLFKKIDKEDNIIIHNWDRTAMEFENILKKPKQYVGNNKYAEKSKDVIGNNKYDIKSKEITDEEINKIIEKNHKKVYIIQGWGEKPNLEDDYELKKIGKIRPANIWSVRKK